MTKHRSMQLLLLQDRIAIMSSLKIVELPLGIRPSPGGSGEKFFMSDNNCFVVFLSINAKPAVARFVGASQSKFGYPNDEAQPGHSLYSDWRYSFYEVVGSEWSEQLIAQNRITFPDPRVQFNKKHFLGIFHETMLEVLADSIEVREFDDNFNTVAIAHYAEALNDTSPAVIAPRVSQIG